MTAIETLLAGLIDYAGLFPPAALDMPAAVRNYLDYRSSRHAFALGRFIVDIARLDEFRAAAGNSLSRIPISLIATTSLPEIESALHCGLAIESLEIKCAEPLTICRIAERTLTRVATYFEIPVQSGCSDAIDAIASVGARAKLRMGGLVHDAFPPPDHVVEWLQLAADRRLAFKATAGLHHPIRSRHPFTYAADGPCGLMHGFVNFFCAAAFVLSGDKVRALEVLAEEDPSAFRIGRDALAWRSHDWTTDRVRTIRQEFFTSYGSCSFVEPLQDLEALGWL